LWAALAVAAAVFALFLRGRRLEGELARAKVNAESAKAKAEVARFRGAAEVHLQAAAEKAVKVQRLEATRAAVRESGERERKELSAMSPTELDAAYLALAREKAPRP
jgi:hypothetical protein